MGYSLVRVRLPLFVYALWSSVCVVFIGNPKMTTVHKMNDITRRQNVTRQINRLTAGHTANASVFLFSPTAPISFL